MSAAIAPAEAAEPARISLYAATQSDAQAYDSDAAGAGMGDLGRSSITYGMAMIPKPTPTPTPVPEPVPEPAAAASSSSSSSEASAPPEESSEASSSEAAASPLYSGGGAPADWMAAAGIAESDWGYVDYIVSRESGWDPNATNSSSGACGLVQALPCSKVPGNGYDPVDNLRWANDYAVGRYGSWASAYDFWISNHWW